MTSSVYGNNQKVQDSNASKVQKTASESTEETAAETKVRKPFLQPPCLMNPFTAFFLLDKLSIESEAFSFAVDKNDLKANNQRWEEARKIELEKRAEARKKEESTKSWSVAMKVFSWMASFIALMTGVVMIATGVGAVAGGLLIAGGAIQIVNQIMNETGAWQKIADLLPGDDIAKKGAVATWMQIGVMVLSIILSGASAVFGSVSAVKEGLQSAFNLFLAGLAISKGIVGLGVGITQSNYLNHLGDVKVHEGRIAKLKHKRQDLKERTAESIERLKAIYDSIALNLEMRDDIENIYNQRFSH